MMKIAFLSSFLVSSAVACSIGDIAGLDGVDLTANVKIATVGDSSNAYKTMVRWMEMMI
jgi:hypothetical protein